MFVIKKPKRSSFPSTATVLSLVAALSFIIVTIWALIQYKNHHIDNSILLSSPLQHAASNPCETPSAFKNNTDLEGYVVVAGGTSGSTAGGLNTKTEKECCEACAQTKGCNVWVWGHENMGKQCWLKRVDKAKDVSTRGSGPSVQWTSGVLDKDWSHNWSELPPASSSMSKVELKTSYGNIRIKLMPEWSETSVEYVRLLAANALCSSECKLYRAEPGFLLQGVIRGFLPANKVTKEGPKIMERGEIGWAGGASGPDFFIYLGKEPATHFGKSHTVWGVIADDESMAVVEKIVMRPAKSEVPGGMHMIEEKMPIEIRPS